jgi:integrase/recombinase XerD
MQAASVKLILKNNKQNSLGKYPIYLRITANRKTSFVSTGFYIEKNQWNERSESVKQSHKEHEHINTSILNQKKQYLDEILQAAIDNKFKSASAIKQVIADELRNIFRFSDKLQSEVAGRRSASTITNYKKHMKKLELYAGNKIVLFDHITPDYLRAFEAWLRDKVKVREGSDPNNYIAAIMRTIRSHFNEAVSRGITNNYPFGKNRYQLPNETPGNKDFLSLAELKKWHEFTFETSHAVYSQVSLYFLFACYTGLRLSDWQDFAEGKIRDRNISLKATKNKSWVNVPLHAGLVQVIKRMKEIPLTIPEPTLNKKLKKLYD